MASTAGNDNAMIKNTEDQPLADPKFHQIQVVLEHPSIDIGEKAILHSKTHNELREDANPFESLSLLRKAFSTQ